MPFSPTTRNPQPEVLFPDFRIPTSDFFFMPYSLCPMLFAPCPLPHALFSRNPILATRYLALTIFGSKVSRSPSPSKLNPSTAQAMAQPGKMAIQGERVIYV
jgi:hypothetical protein